MESFLRCYLDCFNKLPRNSLHDRRKRQHVVDYISTLIEGCSKVEKDSDESAIEAIKTILKYHQENKDDNGKVTMLLDEIYKCEKTFERILIGAIFGNKAPHYIAGWKSDFDSEEENIRAVVYFLDKANRAQFNLFLDFNPKEESFRFIDLPIESCGKASPLKVSFKIYILHKHLPSTWSTRYKLLIFLRFGAKVYTQNEDITLFEHILNRLLEFNHVYPYNLVACLQLLLRAVTRIKIDKPNDISQESYQLLLEKMYERYFDLIQDGLIPPERCGISPPQLKHICRCVIRDRLWENYQLPDGIRSLPVPEQLWRYLDLLED
ncbi:unnamed protein product [Diabrotica balteata]|uniref:SOCS box domain-containing protein n=1 Tax=Diabrotica balteata TaxID=107213 RepID=A0A9N9XBM4_DIABA|nr:unnamed protein product [Diabrotica balteata]